MKTNEKFLVCFEAHKDTNKEGVREREIKTATQISYCISLIICHPPANYSSSTL